MKKVVVYRDEWDRGRGIDDTYLKHPDTGKLSALGFAALACGYNEEDLVGIQTARKLSYNAGPLWTVVDDSHKMDKMRFMSDVESLTDEERERKLTEHGRWYDLEFVFEDTRRTD